MAQDSLRFTFKISEITSYDNIQRLNLALADNSKRFPAQALFYIEENPDKKYKVGDIFTATFVLN